MAASEHVFEIVDNMNIDDLVKELLLPELHSTSHIADVREDINNNDIILDDNVPDVADYVSLPMSDIAGIPKEDAEPSGHTCGVCEAVFTRKDALKRHLTIHTENEALHCSKCGSTFKRKDSLTRHEKEKHGTGDPCVCQICGSVQTSKRNLKLHSLHAHEKPNVTCNVCEKSFSSRSSLNRHVEHLHHNSKEECGHCHKSFKNIKEHVAICSNRFRSKRYTCHVCSKKFKEKRYLKEHIHYKHGQERYSCAKFGAMFAHRKSRIEHEQFCAK